MKPLISLRTKFNVFTIFSTAVLLSTIILYFYFSGRNAIQKLSEEQLTVYKNLIKTNFEYEFKNCTYEIDGLASQLSSETLKLGLPMSVKSFIMGYAEKYKAVGIFRTGDKTLNFYSPVKVFGGEIKIETAPVSSIQKYAGLTDKEFLSSEIISEWKNVEQNKTIEFISMKPETGGFALIAEVPFNWFFEQVMLKTPFPENMEIFITDFGGWVIEASKVKSIHQNIKKIFSEISDDGQVYQQQLFFNHSVVTAVKLKRFPEISIFIRSDIKSQVGKFNFTLMKMIAFSVFILLVVIVLTAVFSHKMALSLNRITSVANVVAKGDFSEKINLQRNDELGLLVNTFNEMTDKLAESYNDLNKANVDLKYKIEELKRTKDELTQKQRLALVGETISKISHEIQNKIGGVSIWVQNLNMYAGNDETVAIYTREITEALDSFMDKLKDFKRFYRAPVLNKTTFSTHDFIEEALFHLTGEISGKKITIEKNIDAGIPRITGDKEQLEEALINLLINALYYSSENSKVELGVHSKNNHILISVKDNGPGIQGDCFSKIFEPFYTCKQSGSGLGLAVTKSIIEAHSGYITAENLEAGGACFAVSIPMLEESNENITGRRR